MRCWQVVLLAFISVFGCHAQPSPDGSLDYVTDLDAALQKATQTNRRVMLYTGTPFRLMGETPRSYFEKYFVGTNVTIRKALPGWVICERFFPHEERMKMIPLADKYGITVFGPTITLLDAAGGKIAGPFGSMNSSSGSLARHLDPPPVKTAEEVAKGKKFAIFSCRDLDSPQKTSGPLVAAVPFLTVTEYSVLGEEHQLRVKEVVLEPWTDGKGGFHVVMVYASGQIEPPLPSETDLVVLLDGVFYRATGGHITNPEIKGVGAVQVAPGDHWLKVSVDKPEQVDALKKALEAAR